ncbi:MAG: hydroxymethylglutaryl-CoA lyase [Actinobacteria bacterium 69-20]|nr:hydroxymethylglutaryl-CoA lyase [Actinomycetota bacterium]OJV24476.1 MAG: hydroxymethylglutaryl-CoA lyase [Actinobacteria bacterium 69-20]
MTAGLPDVVPAADLPSRIQIVEVGPRDGLQNESKPIDAAAKIEFIDRLGAAGLTVIESTSFVDPGWVPQLADAGQVFPAIARRPGVRYPVLVPNMRGFQRAVAAGASEIAVFGSATETFARKNLASTFERQFDMFRPVVDGALERGMRVRGYLSMCFGDPWEGPVPAYDVVRAGKRLLDLGCAELSLGDTIGVATAGQVSALLGAFAEAGVGPDRLAVHFHDTYGQALANTLAALRFGVATVDASAGGLGGCPYAKSATGNLATEDLVWALTGLGIEHGVDLPALVATSVWMARLLGRPSPSAVVRALASGAM